MSDHQTQDRVLREAVVRCSHCNHRVIVSERHQKCQFCGEWEWIIEFLSFEAAASVSPAGAPPECRERNCISFYMDRATGEPYPCPHVRRPVGETVPPAPARPSLISYTTAYTAEQRDAAFLRMYAAKVRDRTAAAWEIPNTVADTLDDIANRISQREAAALPVRADTPQLTEEQADTRQSPVSLSERQDLRARVETAPSREHELKTWPDYFVHLLDGTKTFEYRRNDRGFREGDVLHLREWEPDFGRYTGREMRRRVTYILSTTPQFVIMALAAEVQADAPAPQDTGAK